MFNDYIIIKYTLLFRYAVCKSDRKNNKILNYLPCKIILHTHVNSAL